MLETPRIPRYSSTNDSENASGADNQQERLGRRARESSEAIRQTSDLSDDEMVPSAWRHAVDVIEGSDVQFGRVRIRLERNSLSGNRIARAGSNSGEQNRLITGKPSLYAARQGRRDAKG